MRLLTASLSGRCATRRRAGPSHALHDAPGLERQVPSVVQRPAVPLAACVEMAVVFLGFAPRWHVTSTGQRAGGQQPRRSASHPWWPAVQLACATALPQTIAQYLARLPPGPPKDMSHLGVVWRRRCAYDSGGGSIPS